MSPSGAVEVNVGLREAKHGEKWWLCWNIIDLSFGFHSTDLSLSATVLRSNPLPGSLCLFLGLG